MYKPNPNRSCALFTIDYTSQTLSLQQQEIDKTSQIHTEKQRFPLKFTIQAGAFS